MVMEAEKPQDLSGEAVDLGEMSMWGLRRDISRQAQDPEEPVLQFKSKGKKKPLSQLKPAGGVPSCWSGVVFFGRVGPSGRRVCVREDQVLAQSAHPEILSQTQNGV